VSECGEKLAKDEDRVGGSGVDQEWPPGPVMVRRKRLLPRARVTTAVVPLPSRAMAAAMRERLGSVLEEVPHSAEVALALFADVGNQRGWEWAG